MVYYQYSRTANIYLADVIRDYFPNSNADFRAELGIMLDNISTNGEVYALKQLKQRVPIHHIIKFCDLMETRLRGYNNVSQMQYLKNEIDYYREKQLTDELERKIRSNNTVQLALIGVLVLYVVLYYFFTIQNSLVMFQ
jgi:hypothetical protein